MNQPFGDIEISELNELPKLEKFIEETLDYNNTPAEYFGNILLAVSEAAQMMIRHLEKSASITIRVNRSSKGLAVSFIQKQQKESQFRDIIDMALQKQHLIRETFMIQSLTDDIMVGKDGSSMKLLFEISGISYERALKRSEKVRDYLRTGVKVVDTNEHK